MKILAFLLANVLAIGVILVGWQAYEAQNVEVSIVTPEVSESDLSFLEVTCEPLDLFAFDSPNTLNAHISNRLAEFSNGTSIGAVGSKVDLDLSKNAQDHDEFLTAIREAKQTAIEMDKAVLQRFIDHAVRTNIKYSGDIRGGNQTAASWVSELKLPFFGDPSIQTELCLHKARRVAEVSKYDLQADANLLRLSAATSSGFDRPEHVGKTIGFTSQVIDIKPCIPTTNLRLDNGQQCLFVSSISGLTRIDASLIVADLQSVRELSVGSEISVGSCLITVPAEIETYGIEEFLGAMSAETMTKSAGALAALLIGSYDTAIAAGSEAAVAAAAESEAVESEFKELLVITCVSDQIVNVSPAVILE